MELLINFIIGIVGTAIAGGISFFSQLFFNWRNNQRNFYQLRIDTYANAIRYLYVLNRTNNCNGHERDAIEEEGELYTKFYPIFMFIVNQDTLEKYNAIRNELSDKKITLSDAYQQVKDLLNFYIDEKSGRAKSFHK